MRGDEYSTKSVLEMIGFIGPMVDSKPNKSDSRQIILRNIDIDVEFNEFIYYESGRAVKHIIGTKADVEVMRVVVPVEINVEDCLFQKRGRFQCQVHTTHKILDHRTPN